MCRNPFVNQVFGFLEEIMEKWTCHECGRNPFVNQVFGF